MITLNLDDLRKHFCPCFAVKFLVMVNERAGMAELLEHCRARGMIEWDAMNRKCAGGVQSPVVMWMEHP